MVDTKDQQQPGFTHWITMPHGNTVGFYNQEVIEDGKVRREPTYLTDLWTTNAVRFIEQNRAKPFFLMLTYNGPYGLGTAMKEQSRNRHAAYYAERAAGGAGLIITEEHSTHPTDWPYEKLIHGFNPAVVDGYRRITDAVHHHRTPIFAQINHNGGQASSMFSRLPVWAPSAVADPLFREVPKAVDHLEIAEIVAGYAEGSAASRLTAEVNVAMVYLGMLGRAPDSGGWAYWVPIARTRSVDALVVGFQHSTEYVNRVT